MARWPYGTARWLRLRAHKLRTDPLCEYCPPGFLTPATVVDHRLAINKGGDPFALDNLASSCAHCHNRHKQSEEKGGSGFKRGCSADGWPNDPAHPWRG